MSVLGDIRRVKAARKRHRCDWCNEHIEVGTAYLWWIWVDGDFVRVRAHPECDAAFHTAASEEQDDVLFDGGRSRGCTCERGEPCKVCRAKKEALNP